MKNFLSSLIDNDHIWMVRNFIKNTGSSLTDPIVNKIFSNYLPIKNIKFAFNQFGKPSFISPTSDRIYFSLSHSQKMLVIYISKQEEIGIDIEYIKKRAYLQQIADRYFPEQTHNLIGFYRSWTARESFVKAIGSSLFSCFQQIKCETIDDYIYIGLGGSSSHKVSFFNLDDNYLAAACRLKENHKNIKILTADAL